MGRQCAAPGLPPRVHTMSENFQTFTARVLPADLQFDVEGDLTLLEAAEMSRVQLPSSCRNGTCRTCLCQLVSGTVRYTIEWPGLSAEEKAEGCVLPCVAQPTSDVVLDQALAKAA
jgi:ferredoxin